MVRGFGLLLVAGVVIAFAARADRRLRRARRCAAGRAPRPAGAPAFAGPGAGAAARPRRARSRRRRPAAASAAAPSPSRSPSPARVLAVALALAACGWVAGTADRHRLRHPPAGAAGPARGPDLKELQDATGVSGELDVSVTRRDLTDPALIAVDGGLQAAGARVERLRRRVPELPQGRDLPRSRADRLPHQRPSRGHAQPDPQTLLDALPAYDLQAVVTSRPDGELGDTANIAFGIAHDAARRAAGADRPDPGRDRPARPRQRAAAGHRRRARRACRCWRRSRAPTSRTAATGSPSPASLAVALALLAVYRSAARALVPLIADRRSRPAGRRWSSRRWTSRSTRCRRRSGRW